MRVLWLSPWLRPLARANVEGLRALGVEVMLITAPLHPESDALREYEVELLGRPLPHKGWLPFIAAHKGAKRFKPDVVVTEFLRDVRWRAFGSLAPRVRLVHDARPHDPTDVLPWWTRMFFDRWDATADATVVFSRYVSDAIRAKGVLRQPLYEAPLTSDLDDFSVPAFVAAAARKNFVMIGRQKPYKNHDVVFAAWEAHTAGPFWRGDELVLLGDGLIPRPLPNHARWQRGSYRYRQITPELAAYKGSIVHSRAASQSGVQVLSMQLGVPTLVSTAGALSEYQPQGLSVTGIDDVEALASAIDALADPSEVNRQAKVAQAHYQTHFAAEIAAGRLLEIFTDILRGDQGATVDRPGDGLGQRG
ncbi:glycosyltransferase family 4 protein [Mycobacterium antarcticum]|uniref:glycosyltransferase family 4 protein n=1 Tax=unclassified Mycolicibacterium TaxID=2636767 RepID=UPI0024E14894|nr:MULTISPECIES: glycosyltransferase family 4 protein [unclassified Mycolicibacterium]